SGSITRKFGPSRKQSTGHTSTQSVYLHLIQFSVTTWVIQELRVPGGRCIIEAILPNARRRGDQDPGAGSGGRPAGARYAMVCRNVSRQQFRAIMIITSLLDTDLYKFSM